VKAADFIRSARDRLTSSDSAWTQGEFARDDAGIGCAPSANGARAWSALGAIAVALTRDVWRSAFNRNRLLAEQDLALVTLAHVVAPEWTGWATEHPTMAAMHAQARVAEWNDVPSRTRADVLEVFDKAIALLEANEIDGWSWWLGFKGLPWAHDGRDAGGARRVSGGGTEAVQ